MWKRTVWTVTAWRRGERGTVLAIALLSLAALSAIGIGAITLTSTSLSVTTNTRDSMQAFYVAEAGVADAQNRLLSGEISDRGRRTDPLWNAANVYSSTGFNNRFTIRHPVQDGSVVKDKTGFPLYLVTSLGTSGQAQRQIQVLLRAEPPFVPKGALNIFGDVTKHAKLTLNDQAFINGKDTGTESPEDGLAIGVEDASALQDIIKSLAKYQHKLQKKNGDLADNLQGSPMTQYTDDKGKTFYASLGAVESHGFDATLMEGLAEKWSAEVRALTPTLTIDLGKKDKKNEALPPAGSDQVIRLGGSPSDVVLVKDGTLKLEKGISVEGTGTLIIDAGDVNLHDVTFKWTGDIYILGDASKRDAAKLQNHHANLKIDGDVFVLGANDGKAQLHFNNDGGKNDGSSTINGTVVAYSGTGSKSKAELKAKHGNLEIHGMVNMIGSKIDLDLSGKSIAIEGQIDVMVPNAHYDVKKSDVKINLRPNEKKDEGEHLEVQYNSDIVRAAIGRLINKIDVPMPVRPISWSETVASSTF